MEYCVLSLKRFAKLNRCMTIANFLLINLLSVCCVYRVEKAATEMGFNTVDVKISSPKRIDNEKFRTMWNAGISGKEIAKTFNISLQYVWEKRLCLNLKSRVKKTIYNKKLIITDYKNGLSLPDIVKKHGICLSYAYTIVSNAGIGRTQSEAMLMNSSHQIEWHKLSKIGLSTRIISIAATYLKELGFNPYDNLLGKWKIDKTHNSLILEIKTEGSV